MVCRRIFTPTTPRYTARVRLLLWMHFHRRSPSALMPLRPEWDQIGCSLIRTKPRFCAAREAGASINFHPLECWLTASTSLLWSPSAISVDLSMRIHVQKTVSWCFAALRQLRHIRRYVPTSTFQKLVVALVHSRLDYDNGVLMGIPAHLMRRLQSVLNAAAQLIFNLNSTLLKIIAAQRLD